MRNKEGDKIRLQHMLDAISEIESYLADADFKGFAANSMMRFACVKQLEIIGEAGNHITAGTKEKFSSIEWTQIIGMRNVFVHEYFGIDIAVVWEIIIHDIPDLKNKIAGIINHLH
ncbi:MAG: DUF86 domain-containing protein [Lentimicrobium sp.]